MVIQIFSLLSARDLDKQLTRGHSLLRTARIEPPAKIPVQAPVPGGRLLALGKHSFVGGTRAEISHHKGVKCHSHFQKGSEAEPRDYGPVSVALVS